MTRLFLIAALALSACNTATGPSVILSERDTQEAPVRAPAAPTKPRVEGPRWPPQYDGCGNRPCYIPQTEVMQ